MRVAPLVALGLLSMLAGCQSLSWSEKAAESAPQRLQGELSRNGAGLQLRPCQGGATQPVDADESLGLPFVLARLQQEHPGPVFADLGGRAAPAAGKQPAGLRASQLYRLQPGLQACSDAQFAKLIARAAGNAPAWSVSVSPQGMILERSGAKPQALPYVEERLPDGSMSFTSEANGHRLELWLAPGRCADSQSGALSHLQARLILDGAAPLTGCAAQGGLRD